MKVAMRILVMDTVLFALILGENIFKFGQSLLFSNVWNIEICSTDPKKSFVLIF